MTSMALDIELIMLEDLDHNRACLSVFYTADDFMYHYERIS